MGLIPRDKILEITNANDIVDVLSDYIELKKSGKNYKALCPFHQEKTPSFFVSPDRQSWRCFGQCHEGGDVVEFIMKIENMTFVDALKLLADRANIPVVYERSAPRDRNEVSTSDLYEILKHAGKFYESKLRGSVGAEYFKSRGITGEMAKQFKLGFAPDGWDHLQHKLKFVTGENLEKAGLVLPRKSGDGFYDRFRNRVMFPIIDSRDRVIGFGARTLGEDTPKYLNSPATAVYNKSKALFGMAQAAAEIRRVRRAIIMEGYTDVIMAHQFGFQTAVATCGTALTDEHIRELNAADKLFLLFDGDEAGKNAAERTIPMLIQAEKDAKIILFPNNSDPCEFLLAQGDEAFAELVENGQDYLSFKFVRISERYDVNTPFGLNKSVADCVELIRASKTPAMRMHLVQACAKFLNKPERVLEEQAFPKARKSRVQDISDLVSDDIKKQGVYPEVENLANTLIMLCMNLPDKISEIRDNFSTLNYSPEAQEILDSFFKANDDKNQYKQIHSILSDKAKRRIDLIDVKFWKNDDVGSKMRNEVQNYDATFANCLLIKKSIEFLNMIKVLRSRMKIVKDEEKKEILLNKLRMIQQELGKITKKLKV